MRARKLFALIVPLYLLLIPIFPAWGEVMYKEGKIPIPKFPASKLPNDYRPPDWKAYPWKPGGKDVLIDARQERGAEKIMWRAKDLFDSGFTSETQAFLMDENRFGHTRRLFGYRVVLVWYEKFQDLLNYDGGYVRPGEQEFKDIIYFSDPPQLRGLGSLTWKYMETPAAKREQDRWVYVPALRRTRRLAAGADDDKIGGTDFTVDDVGQREIWEEEYILIGEDQLGPDEHQFYNINLAVPNPWGAVDEIKDYYRPKPYFDCWVIVAVNRKPKYYFPKRIIWLDKKHGFLVREEQYDFHDNLNKVYEYGWKLYDKELPKEWGQRTGPYSERVFWNIWDLKINHRTFNSIYKWKFNTNAFLSWYGEGLKEGKVPDSFFDVKRMEREEWGKATRTAPKLKSITDFVKRPLLLRGKQNRFAPYRKIVLPEEIEKKLIEEYGE